VVFGPPVIQVVVCLKVVWSHQYPSRWLTEDGANRCRVIHGRTRFVCMMHPGSPPLSEDEDLLMLLLD
jgi:hypothetical protein